jgi:hypothetical protein
MRCSCTDYFSAVQCSAVQCSALSCFIMYPKQIRGLKNRRYINKIGELWLVYEDRDSLTFAWSLKSLANTYQYGFASRDPAGTIWEADSYSHPTSHSTPLCSILLIGFTRKGTDSTINIYCCGLFSQLVDSFKIFDSSTSKRYSFLHNIQTDSGAHPASCLVGTRPDSLRVSQGHEAHQSPSSS